MHVRRVAIEINLGRVPPPAESAVECAGCDRRVPVSAADDPPYLCPDCHLEPGDLVIDVEGDERTPLLVVSDPGLLADAVSVPDDGRTVCEYPGNGDHPPDAPVVEAVYPRAVSVDRAPRRYLFPVVRLGKPDPETDRPNSPTPSDTFRRRDAVPAARLPRRPVRSRARPGPGRDRTVSTPPPARNHA